MVTSEKNSSSVEKLVDSKESLLEESNSYTVSNDHATPNVEVVEEMCNQVQSSFSNASLDPPESPNHNYDKKSIDMSTESPIKLELRPSNVADYENDDESVEAVLEFLDNVINGEDSDNDEDENMLEINTTATKCEPFFEPNISKKIETSMQLFSSMLVHETTDFDGNRDSSANVDLTDITPVFDDWMTYDFDTHKTRPEFPFINESSMTFECKNDSQCDEVYDDGWQATSEPLEEVFDFEQSHDVTSAILDLRLQLEEMLPHSGGNNNEFFNQQDDDDELNEENQIEDEAATSEPEPFKKQSNELLLNYKRSLSPIVEEPEAEDQPSSIRSMNKLSSFNDSTTSAESSSFNALDALMGQIPRTLYASNDTLFAFEDSFNDNDIVSPRKLQPQQEFAKKSVDENTQSLRVNDVDSEMSNADEHTDSHSTQPTIGHDFTASNEMKTCISVDKEDERLSEISEPTFDSEMSEKTDFNFDFRLPNYWQADEIDENYVNEQGSEKIEVS